MIELIYNARYQALTMLKNRGYHISTSLFNMNMERFTILYNEYMDGNETILDILIKNKDGIAKISWIPIIKESKITNIVELFKLDICNFREITNHSDVGISNKDNLVIILINKNKNEMESKDYFINNINIENNYTSLFTLFQLQVNITEHYLVPKHILLNKKEIINLRKKNFINLPAIIRFANNSYGDLETVGDPIARYYGLQTNDIVKIIRNSNKDNCQNIFFRKVYDESNSNSIITSEIKKSLYIPNITDFE